MAESFAYILSNSSGNWFNDGDTFSYVDVDAGAVFSFQVTWECLYFDVISIVLGLLLYRVWRGWLSYVGWLNLSVIIFIVVTLLNYLRILVAARLASSGYSWFWFHDFVDYVLWYGLALCFFIISVFRGGRDLDQKGV
jgi:hypothetical protein